jgi:DNA primase
MSILPEFQARIQGFLGRLDGVRETHNGSWTARCPAHDDKNPSLSVSVSPDGKILAHCHAGCSFKDIV